MASTSNNAKEVSKALRKFDRKEKLCTEELFAYVEGTEYETNKRIKLENKEEKLQNKVEEPKNKEEEPKNKKEKRKINEEELKNEEEESKNKEEEPKNKEENPEDGKKKSENRKKKSTGDARAVPTPNLYEILVLNEDMPEESNVSTKDSENDEIELTEENPKEEQVFQVVAEIHEDPDTKIAAKKMRWMS